MTYVRIDIRSLGPHSIAVIDCGSRLPADVIVDDYICYAPIMVRRQSAVNVPVPERVRSYVLVLWRTSTSTGSIPRGSHVLRTLSQVHVECNWVLPDALVEHVVSLMF